MSRKVTNTIPMAGDSYLLSQTPPDYDTRNFYLKELQDKVNAEWRFRPNRVGVEYESAWGEGGYEPIEVVVQTVKSDKGTPYSDDYRKFVFRDIREKRFGIGNKFRFAYDYSDSAEKDYWLVTNIASIKATTSAVVQRCVAMLRSAVFKTSDGHDTKEVIGYHDEPAILGTELTSVGLFYNETAISPQSQLIALVQHNAYTGKYHVNQRFVIGYDKVYRIKALNKFYSKTTKDPMDVGLMRVYLEITEESPYDIFGDDRIAYQEDQGVGLEQDPGNGSYEVRFTSPEVLPEKLTKEPIEFSASAYLDGAPIAATVSYSVSLVGLPSGVDVSRYVDVEEEGGSITLSLKRIYLDGDVVLTASAEVDGKTVSASFGMTAVRME